MYAITVRPDNTGAEVELAVDGSGKALLDALYREIGSEYLEALQLAPDLSMWFDDEAGELPVNRAATGIGGTLGHGRPIIGTVVYTGVADSQGATQALSNECGAWLRAQLEDMGVTL